jgi:SAM-dependent methyltransferase
MSVTQPSPEHIRPALRERGLTGAVAAGFREVVEKAASSYWYCRAFHTGRSFDFQGRRYRYLYRRYNSTWRNERAVEVPVVWDVVKEYAGRRVLEVGNVLAHYFDVTHDRVDKYERGSGVLNEDIVDFRPRERYDLIVSISTLEHVGWDEEPRDPDKVLRAVETLKRLAAVGGRILVTVPMAYNPEMDARLRDGRISFTRRACLKRISRDNRWAEVEWAEVEHAAFDTPFRRINGLVFLELGVG